MAARGKDIAVASRGDVGALYHYATEYGKEDFAQILQRAQQTQGQRLALVFGNEADGLNNDELGQCQACLQLPMPGDFKSFNLSHAVAITLFMLHQEPPIKSTTETLATQHELLGLERIWLDALEKHGFFRRAERQRFAPKLQRLINRLHISPKDVQGLYGMFRHLVVNSDDKN